MSRVGRLTEAWAYGGTLVKTLPPHLGLVYRLLLWSTFRETFEGGPGLWCGLHDGKILTNRVKPTWSKYRIQLL